MTDKEIIELMQPYINCLSIQDERLFFNGHNVGMAEIFYQTRSERGGNGIEIGRLYIDDTYQKQGIGGSLIDKLLKDNPKIEFIDVYPGGKSEPFWLRQGPADVDEEGYFRITRESRNKLPTKNILYSLDDAVQQYRDIEKKYIKDDLSKLRKEQWIMVRTDVFKAWFGDWENGSGSKVLDSNGEPLVVFHGSRSPYLDRFNLEMEGSGTSGSSKFGGLWFTSSESNAAYFADQRDDTEASNVITYGDDQFFALIEDVDGNNLFQLGPFNTEESAQSAGEYAIEKYNSDTERGSGIYSLFLNIRNPLEVSEKVPRSDEFESAKHNDGIIAVDIYDGCEWGDVFIAFSENQIRSSVGNKKCFDSTTNDLNFKELDHEETLFLRY